MRCPNSSACSQSWCVFSIEARSDSDRSRSSPRRRPCALRIDWRVQGKVPFRLDTGAGQPAVILLHESEQGYAQQYVPDDGPQLREQRAAWLDATPKHRAASLTALVCAAGAMVLQFLRRPSDYRKRACGRRAWRSATGD
jgi:hypothetical protein